MYQEQGDNCPKLSFGEWCGRDVYSSSIGWLKHHDICDKYRGRFICYEVKAATLKSCAGLPSTSSGASLDFASTSHASLLGVVCIKRKSFYHLIEPFVLDTRPGLLFGFFAGIYCWLKSGQSTEVYKRLLLVTRRIKLVYKLTYKLTHTCRLTYRFTRTRRTTYRLVLLTL
jgi:hypothetical protein